MAHPQLLKYVLQEFKDYSLDHKIFYAYKDIKAFSPENEIIITLPKNALLDLESLTIEGTKTILNDGSYINPIEADIQELSIDTGNDNFIDVIQNYDVLFMSMRDTLFTEQEMKNRVKFSHEVYNIPQNRTFEPITQTYNKVLPCTDSNIYMPSFTAESLTVDKVCITAPLTTSPEIVAGYNAVLSVGNEADLLLAYLTYVNNAIIALTGIDPTLPAIPAVFADVNGDSGIVAVLTDVNAYISLVIAAFSDLFDTVILPDLATTDNIGNDDIKNLDPIDNSPTTMAKLLTYCQSTITVLVRNLNSVFIGNHYKNSLISANVSMDLFQPCFEYLQIRLSDLFGVSLTPLARIATGIYTAWTALVSNSAANWNLFLLGAINSYVTELRAYFRLTEAELPNMSMTDGENYSLYDERIQTVVLNSDINSKLVAIFNKVIKHFESFISHYSVSEISRCQYMDAGTSKKFVINKFLGFLSNNRRLLYTNFFNELRIRIKLKNNDNLGSAASTYTWTDLKCTVNTLSSPALLMELIQEYAQETHFLYTSWKSRKYDFSAGSQINIEHNLHECKNLRKLWIIPRLSTYKTHGITRNNMGTNYYRFQKGLLHDYKLRDDHEMTYPKYNKEIMSYFTYLKNTNNLYRDKYINKNQHTFDLINFKYPINFEFPLYAGHDTFDGIDSGGHPKTFYIDIDANIDQTLDAHHIVIFEELKTTLKLFKNADVIIVN